MSWQSARAGGTLRRIAPAAFGLLGAKPITGSDERAADYRVKKTGEGWVVVEDRLLLIA